MAQKREA